MENPLRDEKDWQAVGAASGLGCSIVTSLLICVIGGIFLDRWLGKEPLFTLIGVGLGLVTAGYLLYELAVLGQPDKGHFRKRKSSTTDRRSAADEQEL